jgi:hypothetical protein
MSEVALLPNTDLPQQVEDYVRGYSTQPVEVGQHLVVVQPLT